MESKYINAFHVIEPLQGDDDVNPLNKIFGPCPIVSVDDWPKSGGVYDHHIISVDMSKLNFLQNKNVTAMSIFLAPESVENTSKNPFKVIFVDKKKPVIDKLEYPRGYKSWWENNPEADTFSKGSSYQLSVKLDIPEAIIEEGLNSKETYCQLPEEYEEIENYESYIGGFPIWIQGNETPIQKNGKIAHFLMNLSGHDDWFRMSIIDGYDLFLFLSDDSELLSVGQS